MNKSGMASSLPWLLLAAGLAYLNALAAGFQFDDFNVIVDNARVHSLAAWWADMPGIRPLLKLSYTLNWLADPGPVGFHAVNILLHLINIALVWRLTAFIPAPAGWEDDPALRRARVLATLLFALHPIQTESVTYVSGRSMTLMASFGLAGLLAWLEGTRRPERGLAAGLALRLTALSFFAAALLSKEVAVALPLALLLFGDRAGPRRGAVLGLLLFSGLALAALFLGLGYQRLFAEPLPRELGANLLSEANAVHYLIGQLFRPQAMNIDPVLPELAGWSARSIWQVGAILAALILAWLARKRNAWLSFGIGWFVLLLLPTHTVIPRLDLASERHLYLAGLGLYWLGAVLVTAVLPARRALWRLLVVALAFAGMYYTHERNRDYRDEIGLWQATLREAPGNARAWNNLGWAYQLAGRPGEARAAYIETLRLDPDHEQAEANLRALYPDEPSLNPSASEASR